MISLGLSTASKKISDSDAANGDAAGQEVEGDGVDDPVRCTPL